MLNLEQKDLLDTYSKPIIDLILDNSISDIYIWEFDNIIVKRNGIDEKVKNCFENKGKLKNYLNQVLRMANASEEDNFLSAVLDGHRFQIGLEPSCTPMHAVIRLHRSKFIDIDTLINKYKALTLEQWEFLCDCILDEKNIIFTGKQNSGKTTLIRQLISFINEKEYKINIVEDEPEIKIKPKRGFSSSFTSDRNKMDVAIKHALRCDLDFLVIGEIRFPSTAKTVIEGIEAGFTGLLTSIHTRTPEATVERFVNLISRDSHYSSTDPISSMVNSSIDVIVNCSKNIDTGKRFVSEIGVLENSQYKKIFENL